MMKHLNNIGKNFISIYNDFSKKNLISQEDLGHHYNSDLHSWLQYMLIKAGEQEGLISIPEVKMRFFKPIVYKEYGIKGKNRNSHFKRVDIAYYNYNKKLVGIAEVYTMDESHGARPTQELAKAGHTWLTPYDSIPFLINNSKIKPEFIILVTVLLKKIPHKYWKFRIDKIDNQIKKTKNYYKTFKQSWLKLKKEIHIDNSLLIINEEGVEKY